MDPKTHRRTNKRSHQDICPIISCTSPSKRLLLRGGQTRTGRAAPPPSSDSTRVTPGHIRVLQRIPRPPPITRDSVLLTQLRPGHCITLRAYRHAIGADADTVCTRCGTEETVNHVLSNCAASQLSSRTALDGGTCSLSLDKIPPKSSSSYTRLELAGNNNSRDMYQEEHHPK